MSVKKSWPQDTPIRLYGRKSDKSWDFENEAPNHDKIFWHSRQFSVMELNFLGLETREYTFYCSRSATTIFLAYFLTLEYIVETFRTQFTNIFGKNAKGEKRVCFFPPFPISKGLLTTWILILFHFQIIRNYSFQTYFTWYACCNYFWQNN